MNYRNGGHELSKSVNIWIQGYYGMDNPNLRSKFENSKMTYSDSGGFYRKSLLKQYCLKSSILILKLELITEMITYNRRISSKLTPVISEKFLKFENALRAVLPSFDVPYPESLGKSTIQQTKTTKKLGLLIEDIWFFSKFL